ncbi:hypothetical protein [Actinoplanes palleronii]|uniref:Uncharacterized protein n=1 Tax=Actinoplanes palleronii TaxID=113570 RepID=A0ABQ4BKE8_9ACTN|nr:hypothetical protein [Actinoplanes palleronii]GIE70720.1 hypothetical protein Apa02nite_068280 [Actinoplanes palleronii]
MNAPFLVPCLVTLRAEFNAAAPRRDKGADGWIGDTSHAASISDHNPDEGGRTPYTDADNVDEIHAVDIDSTGPWPDGKGGQPGAWFDRKVNAIVDRERIEWASPTLVGRLQNVIWRGRICSRSDGWVWRDYSGPSQHFDHAHFSARYLTSTEADTRPWGVQEDEMNAAQEAKLDRALTLLGQVPAAVWDHEELDANPNAKPGAMRRVGGDMRSIEYRAGLRQAQLLAAITGVDVDESAVAAAVLAGLTPELIAAAIPADLARQVAQELADRLAS